MFRSLRFGHATNSSSAHSVIMHSSLSKFNAVQGDDLSHIQEGYGETYTAADIRSKAILLTAIMLKGRKNISAHEKVELSILFHNHKLDLNEIFDEAQTHNITELPDTISPPDGIDTAMWIDFILSTPIAVYGYNDNYTPACEKGVIDIMGVELSDNIRWKQDGKAIVGYDNRSGNKFRWSPEEYIKSTTPELVDVKITDYCGYGCSFCYQGSTKQGKHAKLEDLEGIFDQLKDMNCFEIAVGGGEPAHHPEFVEIIKMARARGLTFNFTAFGTDWIKNPDVIEALKCTKWSSGFGVGISVHTTKDLVKVSRARESLRDAGLYLSEVIGQTVVGATPAHVTRELLESSIRERSPLILLGFKRTGRGKDFVVSENERSDVKKLLETAKSHMDLGSPVDCRGFHLSVDTAFLDIYGDVLDEMEVPHVLRTSPEGAFSMYVDAVEMTAGPSSYCDKSLMQPVSDIAQQFKTF